MLPPLFSNPNYGLAISYPKVKYPILNPNIKNHHQQWDERPCHLVLHVYGLFSRLTDWLKFWWRKSLIENRQVTKEVCPPSQWKTNHKITVISVLTSYLYLTGYPFVSMYQQCENNNYFSNKIFFELIWCRSFASGSPDNFETDSPDELSLPPGPT